MSKLNPQKHFPAPQFIAAFAFAFCTVWTQAGDWPQWRGPTSNAQVAKGDRLPARLGDSPKVVWRIDVGPGHSAPVTQGVRLAIAEEKDGFETLRLLDKRTGKLLWEKAFGETYEDRFGAGPRCTPLFDGDRIYVQTCRGELSCLSIKDGSTLWGVDYQKKFKVKWIKNKSQNEAAAARRGYSGTPLVEGDHLICQVGGVPGTGVVCFDKLSGKVVWKSQDDLASFSSPLIMTLAGKRQFVTLATEKILSVDIENGELLWSHPVPTLYFRNVVTPIAAGNSVITASHSEGMLCMSGTGSNGKANRKWNAPKLKINLATPIVVGGSLYSFAEKDRFICVDTATGKLNWEESGFGKFYASTLTDGKRMLVLAQMGELVLLKINPKEYEELDRMQVCGKTWSFPAYADGQLFVRDQKSLQCIKLTGE